MNNLENETNEQFSPEFIKECIEAEKRLKDGKGVKVSNVEELDKILNSDKEFSEEFVNSVLKNRKSNVSEYIDITDETKRKEFLGL